MIPLRKHIGCNSCPILRAQRISVIAQGARTKLISVKEAVLKEIQAVAVSFLLRGVDGFHKVI